MTLHPRAFNSIMILAPLLFLGASIAAQLRYDAILMEHFDLREPVHRYIMPAGIVRHVAFGFENVLADYYWVTAIQDLNKWDRRDTYYAEYFRIIATLDPKFEYPYTFAALTIPSKINPESLAWLADISKLGIAALPSSWQIPFYTGLEFHTVGRSYERAAYYLGIASSIGSSPEVARNAYGLFLLHSSTDYERSRALFTAIYETTDNEETKKIAQDRIALLDLIEAVDRASEKYRSRYMVYPESVEMLAKDGLIQLPPDIVERFPIEIDEQTGKASLL